MNFTYISRLYNYICGVNINNKFFTAMAKKEEAAMTTANKKSFLERVRPAKKEKGGTRVGKNERPLGIDVPDHILEVAYLLKNNQAIRRYTSIGILNYLIQHDEINPDDKGKYVEFKWNKFTVSADGLKKEYSFYEEMFLIAIQAAFKSFAEDAEKVLNNFVDEENKIRQERIDRAKAKYDADSDEAEYDDGNEVEAETANETANED